MIYQYRITKYNPQNRVDGKYTLEEWTSYSHIGRVFSGIILSQEDYLKVEDGYIACVMEILEVCGINNLRISGLELHSKTAKKKWNNRRILKLSEIPDFVKDCLRRKCWARLSANEFFIHFGYEFYMYFGCTKEIEIIEPIAKKNHLFCEVFASPYWKT